MVFEDGSHVRIYPEYGISFSEGVVQPGTRGIVVCRAPEFGEAYSVKFILNGKPTEAIFWEDELLEEVIE